MLFKSYLNLIKRSLFLEVQHSWTGYVYYHPCTSREWDDCSLEVTKLYISYSEKPWDLNASRIRCFNIKTTVIIQSSANDSSFKIIHISVNLFIVQYRRYFGWVQLSLANSLSWLRNGSIWYDYYDFQHSALGH